MPYFKFFTQLRKKPYPKGGSNNYNSEWIEVLLQKREIQTR